MPEREIFVTEFTLSDPIWPGDLRTKPKNPICVKCYADIRHFVFLPMTECAVKNSSPAEHAVKIILRVPSMR